MALCVLAYPDLAKGDYDRIQAFRKEYDGLYYAVVEPHFTLVFPLDSLSPEVLSAAVRREAAAFVAFSFCLRCATLNKDAFSEVYHTFLVPDEGHSRIVKLHDALYTGPLFPHRLLQVDFIPHMVVGNATDPQRCLDMIALWNREEFCIEGRVSRLDIVQYVHPMVRTIEHIDLV